MVGSLMRTRASVAPHSNPSGGKERRSRAKMEPASPPLPRTWVLMEETIWWRRGGHGESIPRSRAGVYRVCIYFQDPVDRWNARAYYSGMERRETTNPLEPPMATSPRFLVSRVFTTGSLKGLTYTEETSVEREVGQEVKHCTWTGPGYVITACERIN